MKHALDSQILRALREDTEPVSSLDLAARFGAPAAIIDVRIAALRDAGFEIEEEPGRGLRLLGSPDRLIADDLASRLDHCAFLREIVVFEETDSTNDVVTRRAREGAGEGLAVFAEKQAAGRGRFERRWESAAHKGVWFSLLLRPSLPASQWPRLSTWAAVVLASAIEDTILARVEIKWPNDVQIAGKKVAGILAEAGVDQSGKPFAVLGIGVNLNHLESDFPPGLREKAGSLRQITGQAVARPAFAARLLKMLDTHVPDLQDAETAFPTIVREAASRSSLLGQRIEVRTGAASLEGIAEALDGDGHLLLRDETGNLHRLTAGEATLSRESGSNRG